MTGSELGTQQSGEAQVRRYTVSTADGVGLAVEERGPVDAEYTVFLDHGLCLSQVSWDPQKKLLERQFGDQVRTVSFDHRGHGRSDSAPMSTYTIEQLGRDHAAVVEAAGVRGLSTMVGHSMGAMALMEYLRLPARQRPVNPDGLVLVATAAGQLAERGLGRLLGLPLIGVVADVLAHTPHRGGDRAVRSLVRPVCRTVTRVCGLCEAERDTLTACMADAVYSTPLTTAVGFLPSLKRFDARSVLPTIQARTVVLSGGADVLTPVAHARELAGAIPGATHRHIAAAGHMLLHEATHAVTDAIGQAIAAESARHGELIAGVAS